MRCSTCGEGYAPFFLGDYVAIYMCNAYIHVLAHAYIHVHTYKHKCTKANEIEIEIEIEIHG